KEANGVDDLLGDLSSGKNAPKTGNPSKGSGANSGKSSSAGAATGAELSGYASQITGAISRNFHDYKSYIGKQCVLRLNLNPDGSLIGITSEGGDEALCTAAKTAARLANLPKPPNDAVYNAVKNNQLVVKFIPQ
ncbi:TPA: cell envelope integrity protein TolA, partial [Klebsiella michiganensis]|nr:cell envelope integrity protein TolA [Klebsiella michiganensis]